MTAGTFRFERFRLDAADRKLTRDGQPVEINARYLDALVLLVRDAGKLVSKDRFLDEVWRGVPVTDEALTQCIRTLRRQLGDDAARPRFIETVPKHGYRFIAPVEGGEAADARAISRTGHDVLRIGLAGTAGGALAGLVGGLIYGFAAAAQPPGADMGALSVLLVLVSITTVVATLGAAGVAFGIAALGPGRPPQWGIAGGALGGMAVGALVKLIGLDAFRLLLGRAPADITGPFEGVLLGGAVGLGAWLASRRSSIRRGAAIAALVAGAAGSLVPLIGGRMMGGSLDLLALEFPQSQLRLDRFAGLFGETGFGPITQIVTGGLEGALFGGCVVGAMMLARRIMGER